jgi:tetratricopeptide (TPR) repeat protein
MPDSRGARSFYAQLLVQRGDWAAADQQWRAALQIVPDDESALEPLIKHLRKNGQADQAWQLMLAAYAYNPRSFDNNLRLVQACRAKGDVAGAVTYMQALAASGPVNARLYFDLAQDLAKLGRYAETRAALARAQRLAEVEGNNAVARSVAEMLAALANHAPND